MWENQEVINLAGVWYWCQGGEWHQWKYKLLWQEKCKSSSLTVNRLKLHAVHGRESQTLTTNILVVGAETETSGIIKVLNQQKEEEKRKGKKESKKKKEEGNEKSVSTDPKCFQLQTLFYFQPTTVSQP